MNGRPGQSQELPKSVYRNLDVVIKNNGMIWMPLSRKDECCGNFSKNCKDCPLSQKVDEDIQKTADQRRSYLSKIGPYTFDITKLRATQTDAEFRKSLNEMLSKSEVEEETQEELWDLVYNNYVTWHDEEFRTKELLRDFTITRKTNGEQE